MRSAIFLTALLLAPAAHANPAAERPVSRVDSLTATEKNDRLTIEAQGAVMGGGWKHPALRLARQSGDAHILVVEFVAEPPEPNDAVIPGLLPVTASLVIKAPRKGLVSVRAVASDNEIISQILK